MKSEASNLLTELIATIEPVGMIWQIGAIVLALVFAWWADAQILKKLAAKKRDVAISGIKRVTFPVMALMVVMLSRLIFTRLAIPVSLLKLATPLLLSLAIIRLLVYVLRNVFPDSGKLKSWERGIAGVAWTMVALHITGLLSVVMTGMDEIVFSFGHQSVSLLVIVQGAISIAATVLAALWAGRFLEVRIMSMDAMDTSSRVLLTKVARGALLVISVLIALSLVGIDIRLLSVFGGALGVGLGFGLQRIASNYISGFIILLDKSIRLGDVITLDNRYGTVSSLTGRYMVLRGKDGAESLIPNETAITATLINHSYTDSKSRIKVTLQISYDSSIDEAMQIMLDAAKSHPLVIAEPEPSVCLLEFADNGLQLELSAWINDLEISQSGLRSEINLTIWREFQRAGIVIPYPQREVRLISKS